MSSYYLPHAIQSQQRNECRRTSKCQPWLPVYNTYEQDKKNEIHVRTYDIKMIDKHKPIVTFAQGYSTKALNTLVKNMELDCKQYN